jgi:hypothetical protein
MKEVKIALYLALTIVLYAGCGAMNNTAQGDAPEEIRRIFVGTWLGKHLESEKNVLRTWVQTRSEDGRYTIIFFQHTEEGIHRSKQKGKWWIDGDRFYEIAPEVMKKPDVYQFEILSEDEIRFKSTVKDYEFIDRRVEAFPPGRLI